MRLMGTKRGRGREARRAETSEHLSGHPDHIKEVVLTVDEDGVIQTFNPTGEAGFRYAEAEVVRQRLAC